MESNIDIVAVNNDNEPDLTELGDDNFIEPLIKEGEPLEINEFSYIHQHYSTELFKIELRGLPKRCDFSVSCQNDYVFILELYF